MSVQDDQKPAKFSRDELPASSVPAQETSIDMEQGKTSDQDDRKLLAKGKSALKAAAVTAELLPFTNEGLRFGSFAYVQTFTHNPILGAAILGGSTLVIEGAGALAASDWIAKDHIKSTIDRIDDKLADTKLAFMSPKRRLPEQPEISPIAEAGIAMTLGSVALLMVKQRENPERTAAQNRKRGLVTASWLGGMFAAEGALVSEGIGNYHNPTTVGGVLVGLAAITAAGHWVKKKVRPQTDERGESMDILTTHNPESLMTSAKCTEVSSGVEISDEALERSAGVYESFRHENDGAVEIGLYGDDLRAAMKDPETVMAKYTVQTEVQPIQMPLLVPIKNLEWYNLPYLQEKYGEDSKLYVYVHPPVPRDEQSQEVINSAVQEVLDSGAIVLMDQYQDRPPFDNDYWTKDEVFGEADSGTPALQRVYANGETYEIERMNENGRLKKADIFVCPVDFNGVETIQEAPSIYDVYQQAIRNGELTIDAQNGPSIEQVMSEEDVQKAWEIYEKPFERLSKGSPVLAGFDEDSLKAMLIDPDIVKVINRQDGELTTIMVFTQDFAHYPWFNEDYFRRTYPEYHETNNILLCPGIVSDEEKRGAAYSWALVDLLSKVCAKRGTNVALSFECTEISTRYIPTKVVARGVEASGLATARNYDKPVATMEYVAFQKAK